MNDQPLVEDPDESSPFGDPRGPVAADGSPVAADGSPNPPTFQQPSIVDQVLDLNDFLRQEVRLAEKSAAFYTRPELEAEIEDLVAELDAMTDSQGNPIAGSDESLDDARTPESLARQIADLQAKYAGSRRTVRMKQMDQDDWAEFQTTWKDVLAKQPPYHPDFYVALISRSAIKPEISPAQVVELRKKLGAPAFEELWTTAWSLNTRSGVSIPKSLLSSAVLSRNQQG